MVHGSGFMAKLNGENCVGVFVFMAKLNGKLVMFDFNLFCFSLQGIPVLARVGANDRTVHPYFVRCVLKLESSHRLLKQFVS